MKSIILIISMALIYTYLFSQIAIMPGAGNGTEESPYEIMSLDNLYWITASNDIVETPDREVRWSSHYLQTDNIYAEETETWFDGEGWPPIGIYIEPDHPDNLSFTGEYNGQNYLIEGLHINRSGQNYIGFWGICEGARIENLGLTDLNVSGGMYVGGLIGLAMDSEIINSYTTGNVLGSDERVGGLIGNNISTFISHCHSRADVVGENQLVAGLLGVDFYSMIENSFSTGDVVTQADYVGGLIGAVNDSYVNKCFSIGNVTGNIRVGGLLGINREYSNVSNCYSRGDVVGYARVGGLSGVVINNGMIQHCYSTGSVSGDNNVGGLVGRQVTGPTAVNSYWDIESSGQTTSASGEGRTTIEMTYPHSDNTYVSWDFTNVWNEDENLDFNDGYPYLQWESILEPNPYIAVDPIPEDNAVDIPVTLVEVSWRYISHQDFSDPIGFRIYMNMTGEFSVDDSFDWVYFVDGQEQYTSSDAIPDLKYDTIYYWKVVPTTDPPGNDLTTASRRYPAQSVIRGDAENCPIWSFITEMDTAVHYPGDNEIISEMIMNYPNPFNPETIIYFSIPELTKAKLEIYNMRGQKVKTLVDKVLEAGNHEIRWDGKDESKTIVTSGIYYYILKTEAYSRTGRMILLK